MYTVTLIPGDHVWTNQATHKCDENGFVMINNCFQNIQIENKEDYLRLRNIIHQEREINGLINVNETSNIWLINNQTDLPYQVGSFIMPSSIQDYYQLKPDLEKCNAHIGLLAKTISFDTIEYVPSKISRTKTTKVKELLTHSYSNEITNEYALWDDTAQDYIVKTEITYQLASSNIVKIIDESYTDENNKFIEKKRSVPIIIEKEITEYEYDQNNEIIYDLDYNNMIPKYPIKYISLSGSEITKEDYLANSTDKYCAMYVPYVKLRCDCNHEH